MKERKRRGVIFFGEGRFGKRVRRCSGEFAVTVVVEHFLKISTSVGKAIEISIAFAKREIGVRLARTSRIIVQIFLVFRDRQIVKLASKQAVGVFELTPVGPLGFARWGFGRVFLQRAENSVD